MKSASRLLTTFFLLNIGYVLLLPNFSCEKLDEITKQDTVFIEKPDSTKIDTTLECYKNNTGDLYISNKLLKSNTWDNNACFVYVFNGIDIKFGDKILSLANGEDVKCFYNLKAKVYNYEVYREKQNPRFPTNPWVLGEISVKKCKSDTLLVK